MTTTEPENITLHFREGSSDKVYQVRIEPAGPRFVVNFAYGRRGSTLNTGTKTNIPVDYPVARRIFDQLVKEKTSKGYRPGVDESAYVHQESRPTGLSPQLLNPIDESEAERLLGDDDWGMQEKYDGRRMLVRKQGAAFDGINRRGFVVGIPAAVVGALQVIPGDFVLDGESIGEVLICFDLLEQDGVDLRPLPYRQRLTGLLNLLASAQQRWIRYPGTAFTTKEKSVLWNQLRSQKREGVVFKRLDAPYRPGRPASGGTQLKHKFYATLSAVVGRINAQRSIELRLRDGAQWVTAGNVTIPPNHRIPVAGSVVEIRYLYSFRESGSLYQPVYLGSRQDVGDRECTVAQVKFKSTTDEDEP